MVEPDLVTQLTLEAGAFAVAYGFWLAHRYPNRNGVTRLLASYVAATKFPGLPTATACRAIAVITLIVGIASLISTIASASGR